MGQGIIVINPYQIPLESVHQANRLKDELEQLGVSASIVTDAFLRSQICQNTIQTTFNDIDFVVYLDKDKYQSEVLESLGIRLFNTHKAVRVCDDKGTTYLALLNSGLNIPKTIFGALCYNKDMPIDTEWAKKIAESLGYPLIIKESFGSMGKGVHLANNLSELLEVMEKVKLKPHLFQEYIGEPGVDVRVIVIGGKAVCAMERRNDTDFRSNVAQGGYGKKITLDDEFKKSAEKCASILGLDYCGVDLLYGKDNKPYVCEVNSNAFISGIEKVTGFNVAKAYAEHIISCLNK